MNTPTLPFTFVLTTMLAFGAGCIEEPEFDDEDVGSDQSEVVMQSWGGTQAGNSAPLAPALLEYTFDSGTAFDWSIYRNHGWAPGVARTADRYGTANRAFEFNNTDMIWVPNESRFDLNTYTFAAWVRVEVLPWTAPTSLPRCADYPIINKGRAYTFTLTNCFGHTGMHLNLDYLASDRYHRVGSTFGARIKMRRWTHVAVTRVGSTVSFYVDGRLEYQKLGLRGAYQNNDNIRIGQNHRGTVFNGKIDEVRIFPRVLSNNELWQLAQE